MGNDLSGVLTLDSEPTTTTPPTTLRIPRARSQAVPNAQITTRLAAILNKKPRNAGRALIVDGDWEFTERRGAWTCTGLVPVPRGKAFLRNSSKGAMDQIKDQKCIPTMGLRFNCDTVPNACASSCTMHILEDCNLKTLSPEHTRSMLMIDLFGELESHNCDYLVALGPGICYRSGDQVSRRGSLSGLQYWLWVVG